MFHDMPQLIVRNLDEEVVARLKQQAGKHGISAEEEHRRILRASLLGEHDGAARSLKDLLLAKPDIDDNSLFDRDRSTEGRNSSNNLFDGE